jgi:hypothetical protein
MQMSWAENGCTVTVEEAKPAQPTADKTDVTTLDAYKALTKHFSESIDLGELTDYAKRAVEVTDGLKAPTAEESRSTDKLYAWFQANWGEISGHLDELADDEKEGDENDEEKASE